MGLDTYAVIPRNDEQGECGYELAPDEAFASVPAVLWGGLFSGNGNGNSFRGKVYDDYVRRVTGVSLYEEFIPPETVKQMAERLERAAQNWELVANDPEDEDEYSITREEARALALWFKVCADNGYAVHGWW